MKLQENTISFQTWICSQDKANLRVEILIRQDMQIKTWMSWIWETKAKEISLFDKVGFQDWLQKLGARDSKEKDSHRYATLQLRQFTIWIVWSTSCGRYSSLYWSW